MIFGICVLTYILLLIASILLWRFWIRNYVTAHGKSLGHGANIGWAIVADASIATDIARDNNAFPWFLSLFWILEFFIWALPITGFVYEIISR